VQSRSSLRWTLAVALAAHAGVMVWASHAARERADGPGPIPSEAVEPIQLYAYAEETSGDRSTTDLEDTREEAPLQSARSTTHLGPAGIEGAQPTTPLHGAAVPGEAAPAPATSSDPTAGGAWTFSPTTGPGLRGGPLSGNGLGRAMQGGVGEILAEDTRWRQELARKHMIPLFTPRDLETGMVPGGGIVGLARDLVRRSRAPDNGRALLQFDTDGAGIVSSVRVLEASSGRAEWDQVASEIATAARGKPPLKVPAGARGLSVTIEVTSAIKTVSGGTPTRNPLARAWNAINDPIDTVIDSKTPAQRVVASHIVDVRAF
jgi:TonB family protein